MTWGLTSTDPDLPEVFFRFQKLKLAKLYESGLLEDSFVQILQK